MEALAAVDQPSASSLLEELLTHWMPGEDGGHAALRALQRMGSDAGDTLPRLQRDIDSPKRLVSSGTADFIERDETWVRPCRRTASTINRHREP